jgi:LacI family transcriptional regulator, gluconate utilization system Gnt-I transcriptional repressor
MAFLQFAMAPTRTPKQQTAPPKPKPGPKRTRRSTGAVTLHHVAQLAGVAPITASRAINTPAQVSAAVLQRVQHAVQQSGYVPNRLAGGLASARSRLVAAVVPTIAGPVFLETVQALTETLADHGYQLMLGQAGYGGAREDSLLGAIIARRPDGIVLTGTVHSALSRQRLLASGIPVVETWDLTPTPGSAAPIDMLVGFSHVAVGRKVAQFLAGLGHQQLAVVTGNDERALRRTQAFSAAARRLKLPPVAVVTVPAPTTLKSGRAALAQLLRSHPAVQAVFCSSDLLALGVLTEAQVQRVKVPQRLAVVGFGDLDFAADLAPALTTVRINGAAIGRQAAQFIVARCAGEVVAQPVVDIGFSIVQRNST